MALIQTDPVLFDAHFTQATTAQALKSIPEKAAVFSALAAKHQDLLLIS
jgi:hypothetical protein